MTSNAMWWVHYKDAKTGQTGMLSLMSPDLTNPSKAHKKARATAKARLAKKGVRATNLRSQCVG